MSHRPIPALETVPGTEARILPSALAPSEWKLRGNRSRAVVLVSGRGHLAIGEARAALSAPCVVWLPAGRSGTLVVEAGSRGAALAIPELALGRAVPAGPVAAQVQEALFHPVLGAKLDAPAARRLCDTIATVGEELAANRPGAQEAVGHHLALVLIEIWRLSGPAVAKPLPSPRATVRNFLHLVDLHIRDHWPVARYARFLGVSTDRLNSAVRRFTGRSPLAVIHDRLIAEAEILLDGSGLQVAEVAEALGFRDAAYFNRFFRRKTGTPPGRHRAAAPRGRAGVDKSFAAWP
ncbi:helix-turn-helix domain-containing protein [Arenibaculum sp.]|uniref:helix-turn-helix domain-containing protein n=1 Tax=Arenibaculum sp. TaxID=2865862 RepID=UPI002E1631A5|nr:helix-turn-helix domain-containing protein [Arenibaculum sp.]